MPKYRADRFEALAAVMLLAAVLTAWIAYSPGRSAWPQFDDQSNLVGLEQVEDFSSGLLFIGKGTAGPLGRPIALASFAMQSDAWPTAPDVLITTNILLHLLNGVLVAWVLVLLGRARGQDQRLSALVGVGAAGLWMLMPLFASSSLMIIQRMNTLSATFVLAGLVSYLHARQRSQQRPWSGLILMTIALGFWGILSIFTKENGALLPLYVLAIEASLLKRPAYISRQTWKIWFGVVLVLPLLVLLSYLATKIPYSESIVLRRGFSGYERLITQAEVLWAYLFNAFIPAVSRIGPFHDDYIVNRSLAEPAAFLSVLAWVGVILAAIRVRKTAPLFAFAVTWFLFGHLIESTTVSLELYFEHRNYLPLVGPIYALVAAISSLQKPWRRLGILAISAYSVIFALILFSVTSLWGRQFIAVEMWHIYKPESMRAAQTLSEYHRITGDNLTAFRVLKQFYEKNPEAHGVGMQVLNTSCQLRPDHDHSEMAENLEEKLPDAQYNQGAHQSLEVLLRSVRSERCKGIDEDTVLAFGEALLANPRFTHAVVRHNIHIVMARVFSGRKDFDRTVWHLEQALTAYPNPDTLESAIGTLLSGGRGDLAQEFLHKMKQVKQPSQPLKAKIWNDTLHLFEIALRNHLDSRTGGE